MACRPQHNSRSLSSDGVPPELEVLGFLRVLCVQPIRPVGVTSLTGRRLKLAGEDRVRSARASACVLTGSASTLVGISACTRLLQQGYLLQELFWSNYRCQLVQPLYLFRDDCDFPKVRIAHLNRTYKSLLWS